MMKKRITAFFLSAAMIFCMWPMGIMASAEEKTTTTSEKFTATAETAQGTFTLAAAPDGSERISTADTEGFCFYSYTYQLSGSSWTKKEAKFSDDTARLYDGMANQYQAYKVDAAPGSRVFFDKTAGIPLTDGTKAYQDIIYDLGGFYDISMFTFATANTQNQFMTGRYEIYASETSDSFTEENRLIEYRNQNRSQVQSFTVKDGETVRARYVALRILSPIDYSYSLMSEEELKTACSGWSENTGYPRLSEFAVYGQPSVIKDNEFTVSSNASKVLPTDLAAGVTAIANPQNNTKAVLSAAQYTYNGSAWQRSGASMAAKEQLYDENAGNECRSGQNGTFYKQVDGAYYPTIDGTEKFLWLSYDLGANYDISKIAVVSSNGNVMTGHYELYVSKASAEYGQMTKIAEFKNTQNDLSQIFSLSDGSSCTARYVALKVINPYPYGYQATGTALDDVKNIYARLAEFQVYGKEYVSHFTAENPTFSDRAAPFADFTAPTLLKNADATVDFYSADGEKLSEEAVNAPELYNNSYMADYESNATVSGGYATFTYDLGKVQGISGLNILFSKDSAKNIGSFDLYASSTSSAIKSAKCLYSYNTADGTFTQHIGKYDRGDLSARYIILKVNTAATDGKIYLSEFNVFGFYEGFTLETTQIAKSAYETTSFITYPRYMNTEKSLIAGEKYTDALVLKDGGTVASAGANLPEFTTVGAVSTNQTFGSGSINFINRSSDGTIVSLKDDETANYLQLNYELDSVSKIDGFALLGHVDRWWSPYHMAVSFANAKDSLFTDAAAKTVDFYNLSNLSKVTLDEAVTAKFVGLRIICGVNPYTIGDTVADSGVRNYYARISHFALFGTFEDTLSTDNISLNSNVDNAKLSLGDITGPMDKNGNHTLGAAVSVSAEEFVEKDGKYYAFSGWYNGEDKVSNEAAFSHPLSKTAVTLSARYEETNGCTVTFYDNCGTAVYKTIVKMGALISESELVKASEAVPARYGYDKMIDHNGFCVWSEDTDSPILSDLSLIAQYQKNAVKYDISVTDTKGNTENYQKAFGERLELSDENAISWSVGENTVAGGPSATLYVCGDMVIKASKDTAATAGVYILSDIADGSKYDVFVHLNNPDGKEIAEAGVMFITGTSFNKVGNVDWTEENLQGVKVARAVVKGKVVNDYFGTLFGISPKSSSVVRAAEAYVTFKDGTTVYSKAVSKTFSPIAANPIIKYSGNENPANDNTSADPTFTYYNGFYYRVFSKDGKVFVQKSADMFNWNKENPVAVLTDPYGSGWFAPEMHMIDGKWYIYGAGKTGRDSLCCQNNPNARSMVVAESATDDPQSAYTFLGQVQNQNHSTIPSTTLSIDGTVLNYGGENYFVWTTEAAIYINKMLNPTTIDPDTVPVKLVSCTESYEMLSASLVEGPGFISHGDKLFMTYSFNDSTSEYYAIGLMTFKDASGKGVMDLSNWSKKTDGPVVSKSDKNGIYGPGHNAFVKYKTDTGLVDYMTYQAHLDPTKSAWVGRNTFVMPIYWDRNGDPIFREPSADIY